MNSKSTTRTGNTGGQTPKGQSIRPVHSIREVFGYVSRYKDQNFVLKIEDSLLSKPLFSLLIKDIVSLQKLGIRIILVPGSKHSIDRVLKTYNIKSPFKDDIRITSEEAMPLVKLAASNVTNAILSLLSENGTHGVVGNWVKARAIGVLDGVDFQCTGKVEKVNVQLLNNMLDDQLIPIVPNLGWNQVGKDYNLNSNELAVAIAKATHASKLFFIGVERGIPALKNGSFTEVNIRQSGVYSNLDLAQAKSLLDLHFTGLNAEHRELVSLAIEACGSGVDRVHVIDGSRDGKLLQEIFSSSGHGTMFYSNQYANIRPASAGDIPEILRIMQPYVDMEVLVQRTVETIGEDLEKYIVYKVDDAVHGCGALRTFSNGTAELEALVVDKNYCGQGTGKKIVSYLLDKSRKEGVKTVFLLTTQSSDFFMHNGFKEASVSILPPERRSTYNTLRNSRVLSINL